MILRLESDGSGGGWKDSVGSSCIIRVFGNGSGEEGSGADGTGNGVAEIYKFMVAANIPAHRPVSNKSFSSFVPKFSMFCSIFCGLAFDK